MKWRNKLKTVLAGTAAARYSSESLETSLRITAEKKMDRVSAVIRSDELTHFSKNRKKSITNDASIFLETNANQQLRITAGTTNEKVSAVIRSYKLRQSPENNEKLAEIKREKLYEILNRYIELGITFDVSIFDFKVIDLAQTLKTSNIEFLKLNEIDVLCLLQQSLLMKHLFSHSPEKLEDFAFEIEERESILTENSKTTYDSYCIAMRDITSYWFERLINA